MSARTPRREGSWIGVYGSQGYNVINSGVSYPSYATVTPAGNHADTWAASTSVPQALQDAPPGTSRIAACWYASTSFTVDVDLTDGQSHNLELYLLDYDTTSRSEQIQLTDANTHAVLSTESVSSFHDGVYLSWTISGNVLITFTKTGGANAVLSGLFFDPTTTLPGVVPVGNRHWGAGRCDRSLQSTGNRSDRHARPTIRSAVVFVDHRSSVRARRGALGQWDQCLQQPGDQSDRHGRHQRQRPGGALAGG